MSTAVCYVRKKEPLFNAFRDVSRQQVFRMFPWLTEKNLPMVTHNDFDGMLTALILHHVNGWKWVGVYDLKSIHLNQEMADLPKDCIFVDLDVSHKDFRSIGHHILGDEENGSLNLNKLFGVDATNFSSKYPLSTAIFLMWLYDLRFEDLSPLAQTFLVHSDNVWQNYERYTENVENWLKHLGLYSVLQFFKRKHYLNAMHKYVHPNTYGRGHQCTFVLKKDGSYGFKGSDTGFQTYMDMLSRVFNISHMEIPKARTIFTFKRAMVSSPFRRHCETLKMLSCEKIIFSHAVHKKESIKLTYLERVPKTNVKACLRT